MMENKSGTALPVDFGYWPGRIVSGRGAVARLGEVVGEVGGRRALVICGSTVARTEMLGKVKAGLGDRLTVLDCAELFADAVTAEHFGEQAAG